MLSRLTGGFIYRRDKLKQVLTTIIASIVLLGCAQRITPQYRNVVDVSYAISDEAGDIYGSSTELGHEIFLTAAHCLGKPDGLFIVDKADTPIKATIVRKDEPNDLALISAPISGPNVRLLTIDPTLGDEVLAIGWPLGMGPTLTRGLWQGNTKIEVEDGVERRYSYITAPLAPGNSGGGVFVLYNGEWYLAAVSQAVPVIAINGFTPNLVFHLGMVSYPPQLKAFLNEKN